LLLTAAAVAAAAAAARAAPQALGAVTVRIAVVTFAALGTLLPPVHRAPSVKKETGVLQVGYPRRTSQGSGRVCQGEGTVRNLLLLLLLLLVRRNEHCGSLEAPARQGTCRQMVVVVVVVVDVGCQGGGGGKGRQSSRVEGRGAVGRLLRKQRRPHSSLWAQFFGIEGRGRRGR
jgi:hypothetical protein